MATFATANAAAVKKSRVLIEIERTGDNVKLCNVADFAMGATITDAVALLSDVSAVSASVEPERGSSQIGSFSFSAIDLDECLTIERALEDWRGNSFTATFGYDSMAEEDFVPLFKGVITSASPKGGKVRFQGADIRRTCKRTVFTAATESSPVNLSGNVIEIALAVLLSTGAGTNGDYDTLAAANGLAIDESMVDVTAFEALRDDYYSGSEFTWSWEIHEPTEGKAWIESEICAPLGLYLVTGRDGVIGLTRTMPPLWADEPTTLTESNIIGEVDVIEGTEDVINEFFWRVGYDVDTDTWASNTLYLDEASLAKYALSERLEIESHSSSTIDATHIARRNSRLFSRFADPAPRYRCECLMSCMQINAGELVALSHPTVIDLVSGSRGIDADNPLLCEVLAVTVDPLKGRVRLVLIGTPWNAGEKYAVIAPASVTHDYDSATDEEKLQYVFIGEGYTVMPG